MKIAGTRFLVTGGTGFIGSALVRALLARGALVRSLDSDARGRRSRLGDLQRPGDDRLELLGGDIRDPATVLRAARGVTSVIHLAYVNGTELFYSQPDLVLEVGVKGMMNVLDACLSTGIRDLVLASSSEVYQSPPVVPTDEHAPLSVPDVLNPRYSYGGGKIISELLAINYGRRHFDRVAIFRPHNCYGPDMGEEHVIPQLVRRLAERLARADASGPAGAAPAVVPLPIQGTGEETRAFVYIDDLVEGVLRIVERGEHLGVYHVGTDEEVSVRELAVAIGACLGVKVRPEAGPLQPGGTRRRCPSIAKLEALGYAAKTPLAEGLRKTIPWYLENRAEGKPA